MRTNVEHSRQGTDTPATLVELLRQMLVIRRFDERAVELRLSGDIHGVVHPYIGEEAIAVGVVSALRDDDRIASHHRGHGHCIAKGADLGRMFAELFGREAGLCRGKGGSMHIADFDRGIIGANGIVGAGIPIGLGAALAGVLSGKDTVVAVFFGDGATGQGVLHESLNYAALAGLPVVFVCENNQYAVETPLELTLPVESVTQIAAGFGLPCEHVDGSDVLAVHEAASRAVVRARAGGGPSFLECRAYRWAAHSQRGARWVDPRPAQLLEEAQERDPIMQLEERLVGSGQLAATAAEELRRAVDEEVETAISWALDCPLPSLATAYEDAYAR